MPSFILPQASLQCMRRLCCCQLNDNWFLVSSRLIRSIGFHLLLIVIGLLALSSGHGYITFSQVFLICCFALLLSNKFIASNVVITCFANLHLKKVEFAGCKISILKYAIWFLCRKLVLHHHHLLLHKLATNVWY